MIKMIKDKKHLLLTIEEFNRILSILNEIDYTPFIGGITQYKQKPNYIIVQTDYSIIRNSSKRLESSYAIPLLALRNDLTVKLYKDYLKVINSDIKWLKRDLSVYITSLNIQNEDRNRFSRLLNKSREDKELAQDEDYLLKLYQTELRSIKNLQNKIRETSLEIEKYIDLSSPWLEYVENEKKKLEQKQEFPCKVCGTYENVSGYSVKYQNGGGSKCILWICPTCLEKAKQNHLTYTYTKLGN